MRIAKETYQGYRQEREKKELYGVLAAIDADQGSRIDMLGKQIGDGAVATRQDGLMFRDNYDGVLPGYEKQYEANPQLRDMALQRWHQRTAPFISGLPTQKMVDRDRKKRVAEIKLERDTEDLKLGMAMANQFVDQKVAEISDRVQRGTIKNREGVARFALTFGELPEPLAALATEFPQLRKQINQELRGKLDTLGRTLPSKASTRLTAYQKKMLELRGVKAQQEADEAQKVAANDAIYNELIAELNAKDYGETGVAGYRKHLLTLARAYKPTNPYLANKLYSSAAKKMPEFIKKKIKKDQGYAATASLLDRGTAQLAAIKMDEEKYKAKGVGELARDVPQDERLPRFASVFKTVATAVRKVQGLEEPSEQSVKETRAFVQKAIADFRTQFHKYLEGIPSQISGKNNYTLAEVAHLVTHAEDAKTRLNSSLSRLQSNNGVIVGDSAYSRYMGDQKGYDKVMKSEIMPILKRFKGMYFYWVSDEDYQKNIVPFLLRDWGQEAD